MTKDEALKMCLEYIETDAHERKYVRHAIKKALAQPEPWEKFCDSNCVWTDHHPDCKLAQPEKTVCPFCTSEWVTAEQHDRNVDKVERRPLSDEEITDAVRDAGLDWHYAWTLNDEESSRLTKFARAIEAAHGIKGEA